MQLLKLYLLIVNLIAFGLFALDKRLARKNKWRIPENRLLITCVMGGAVGGMVAMYLSRHKINKISFRWGVPAILLAQLGLVVFSLRYLSTIQ